MSTDTTEAPATEIAIAVPLSQTPILFPVTDAIVDDMEARYLPLQISGVGDKTGMAAVQKAITDCKGKWNRGDEARKSMTAEARDYEKNVNLKWKPIGLRVRALQAKLEARKDAVEAEEARVAKAKEDALYAERLEKLNQANDGVPLPVSEALIRGMTVERFDAALANVAETARLRKEAEAKAAAEEAERKRLAAEEAERNRVEKEKLDAERAEHEKRVADENAALQRKADEQAAANKAEQNRLNKIRADQEAVAQKERDRLAEVERTQQAERDRLAAEQKRLADAEAERLRQIELEKARAEAAEKARKDAEAKVEREKAEAEERARQVDAARVQSEKMKPFRERLASVGEAVLRIEVPDDVPEQFREARTQIYNVLGQTAQKIRDIAAGVK